MRRIAGPDPRRERQPGYGRHEYRRHDRHRWHDGSAANAANWGYDDGTSQNGWGNNELEYYTSGTANAVVQGETWSSPPRGRPWVHRIILNVAVGGNFPGSPDTTTVFPQTMKVDLVRAYEASQPSNPG